MSTQLGPNKAVRVEIFDWLKGWAIIAVVLDHIKVVPEPLVFWSVNIFVLATAATYAEPGYFFSFKKLLIRIFHLLFLMLLGMFFFKILRAVLHIPNPRPLLDVLIKPYYFFVKNGYLGDVWYTALYLQFLLLIFFCLRSGALKKPRLMFVIAVVVSGLSYYVTHAVLGKFHTIWVGSWLIFLWAGFYTIRPFLKAIAARPKAPNAKYDRLIGMFTAYLLLLALYLFYPSFPWAFTNLHRASAITFPFYVALIFFLTEWFYILEKPPTALKWVKPFIALLGRYTLAIYITHQSFEKIWRLFFSSPLLIACLSTACGIGFGVIGERLFLLAKTGIEKRWPASAARRFGVYDRDRLLKK